MKKCKECKNNVHARGWCQKHYKRWYRNSDPEYTKIEMHGYSNHPLYRVWQQMKSRCCNSNNKQYKDYGGRGIKVCDEWKNSFIIFKEWCLKNGWKQGLEIDRRDNDGNYEPSNCRFVTHKENMHNRRLLMSTNTSGYCGVYFNREREKCQAYITINGKKKYLGLFNSSKKAALAFDRAIPDNRPRNFK